VKITTLALLIGAIVNLVVKTMKLLVMTTVLVLKILVMNKLVALTILFPVMIRMPVP
jgi:hypothetical protein